MVSALDSDCRFFVTGDADFKGMPSGIERVVPDEIGIQNLLRILS
jgi:hypothetical protein